MPDIADSPWLNMAVPVGDHVRHGGLADWFAEHGAEAWGVWTRRGMLVAGCEVETESVAMGSRLDDLDLDLDGAAGELVDLRTVGAINDAVYAHLDERLERATPRLEGSVYAVGLEGSSVALCLEHGGDAGLFYVATLPAARNRGLARAVVKQALLLAREHGCETATLQASEDGLALYEQLGFERLAGLTYWRSRP